MFEIWYSDDMESVRAEYWCVKDQKQMLAAPPQACIAQTPSFKE